MERPAKRCDISFVVGGVQEQAQDVLVPPLLRNCLTLNDTFFSQSFHPLQNSDLCNSVNCLGHSKMFDDDDDDILLQLKASLGTLGNLGVGSVD